MADESDYTLEAALGESVREFVYEYDVGDSWRHHVTVMPSPDRTSIAAIRFASVGLVLRGPRTWAVRVGTRNFSQRSETRDTKTTTVCLLGSARLLIPRASISTRSIGSYPLALEIGWTPERDASLTPYPGNAEH